jgi:hypothetical protein
VDPRGHFASDVKRALRVAARSASISSTALRRSGGPSSVTAKAAPPLIVGCTDTSILVSAPRRTAWSIASRTIW